MNGVLDSNKHDTRYTPTIIKSKSLNANNKNVVDYARIRSIIAGEHDSYIGDENRVLSEDRTRYNRGIHVGL